MAASTRMAAVAAALSAALVVGMAGTAVAFEDLDCSDFTYQEDAQKVFDQDASDPHRLDGGPDGPADGVACESLPRRAATSTTSNDAVETGTATPTTPPEPTTSADEEQDAAAAAESETTTTTATTATTTTTTTTTPSSSTSPTTVEAPAVDRDCRDFATQADAQVALESTPGDLERLDADNDGIACEDSFGTEGSQVAVVPVGGVATGGTPEL